MTSFPRKAAREEDARRYKKRPRDHLPTLTLPTCIRNIDVSSISTMYPLTMSKEGKAESQERRKVGREGMGREGRNRQGLEDPKI